MRRFTHALLASLMIAPSAALFIALLTGSLRQQGLALEWPELIGGSRIEILIVALPGMLTLLLAHRFLRGGRALGAAFAGCALLACILAAFTYAQAFGTTWSNDEILLELVATQFHLIALALLPGTLLVSLLSAQRSLRAP
ncbi:hypothetical protein [Aquipseudomonas alcaligenes]|uniref:hypothetical protein n=1 Tax=Aquipseudomonas alcaligenes TaxID=43263 RepID=UPI003747DCC2